MVVSRLMAPCFIASLVFVAVSCVPARAENDTLRAAQSQAAQVVVTARTAAILCPGVQVDEDAVRSLMDHAQITDRDIISADRFGPEDEAVARSFKSSMGNDPAFCGKVFVYLGERIHLLRRGGAG